LVNILFRKENKIDIIEKAVLSVALSFGIAGIIGLFLGLTIGLNPTSIAVSLSSITIVLAAIAFMLKNKDIKNSEQETTTAKVTNYQKKNIEE
jgi:uncharacterized membrane protein